MSELAKPQTSRSTFASMSGAFLSSATTSRREPAPAPVIHAGSVSAWISPFENEDANQRPQSFRRHAQ